MDDVELIKKKLSETTTNIKQLQSDYDKLILAHTERFKKTFRHTCEYVDAAIKNNGIFKPSLNLVSHILTGNPVLEVSTKTKRIEVLKDAPSICMSTDTEKNTAIVSSMNNSDKLPIYMISCHGDIMPHIVYKKQADDGKLHVYRHDGVEPNFFNPAEGQFIVHTAPFGSVAISDESSDIYFKRIISSPAGFINTLFSPDFKELLTFRIDNESRGTGTDPQQIPRNLKKLEELLADPTNNIDEVKERKLIEEGELEYILAGNDTIDEPETSEQFKYLLSNLNNPMFSLPYYSCINKSLTFEDDDTSFKTASWYMGIFQLNKREMTTDLVDDIMNISANSNVIPIETHEDRLQRIMNIKNPGKYVDDVEAEKRFVERIGASFKITLQELLLIFGKGIYIMSNCSPFKPNLFTYERDGKLVGRERLRRDPQLSIYKNVNDDYLKYMHEMSNRWTECVQDRAVNPKLVAGFLKSLPKLTVSFLDTTVQERNTTKIISSFIGDYYVRNIDAFQLSDKLLEEMDKISGGRKTRRRTRICKRRSIKKRS